jgi:flagellar basal-body rod protein FlgG
MLEGLYTTAAGLAAQQVELDAIGNDLANVNTEGYQSERVAFNDLLYNEVKIAGTETTAGSGANAEIVGRNQAQGALKETGNPLDIAIEGNGYFEVETAAGRTALTREGALTVNADGELVTAGGNRLSPPITLPKGTHASELGIAADGTVTVGTRTIGTIKVVTVTSPGHLTGLGGSLLEPNKETGAVHAASGRIHQGTLEMSNVDLGSEMTNLVTTERAFQMDSDALQNESQMMSIANQLRPPQ